MRGFFFDPIHGFYTILLMKIAYIETPFSINFKDAVDPGLHHTRSITVSLFGRKKSGVIATKRNVGGGHFYRFLNARYAQRNVRRTTKKIHETISL